MLGFMNDEWWITAQTCDLSAPQNKLDFCALFVSSSVCVCARACKVRSLSLGALTSNAAQSARFYHQIPDLGARPSQVFISNRSGVLKRNWQSQTSIRNISFGIYRTEANNPIIFYNLRSNRKRFLLIVLKHFSYFFLLLG